MVINIVFGFYYYITVWGYVLILYKVYFGGSRHP